MKTAINSVIRTAFGTFALATAVFSATSAFARQGEIIEIAIAPEAKGYQASIEHVLYKLLGDIDGDTILVTSAVDGKRLATMTMPEPVGDKPADLKYKLVLRQFSESGELPKVGQFLKSLASSQSYGNLPRFLLGLENRRIEFPGKKLRVYYFGSPVVRGEPAYASLESRYPNDATLVAKDGGFFPLYTTVNRSDRLKGAEVHIIHSANEFAPADPELHAEKLRRWYSLYVERLGGTLATFSSSADHLGKFGAASARISYSDFDPGNGKPFLVDVMPPNVIHTRAETRQALWKARPEASPLPTDLLVGSGIEIGIRWQASVDLDLYARAEGDSNELGFSSTSSRFGRYLHDIQKASGEAFETIQYGGTIDLRTLKLYVNHYAGTTSQPIDVEIRIRANGKVYSSRIRLPAGSGSQAGGNRSANPSWKQIEPLQVVGVSSSLRTASR